MKCRVCSGRRSELTRCAGCIKPVNLCAEHQSACIHCGNEGPFCQDCQLCEACGYDSPGQVKCISCGSAFSSHKDEKGKCIDCLDWYSCQTCLYECQCGLSAIKHYICSDDFLHKCHEPTCLMLVCELAAREHSTCPILGSLRYCHEHRILL